MNIMFSTHILSEENHHKNTVSMDDTCTFIADPLQVGMWRRKVGFDLSVWKFSLSDNQIYVLSSLEVMICK